MEPEQCGGDEGSIHEPAEPPDEHSNGQPEKRSKKRRGRGEGSVEQLPDGRWRAILSLGVAPTTGRRRKRKFYGKSKKEALAKLRDAQANLLHGTLTEPGKMTFAELADRWLSAKQIAVAAKTHHRWKQTCENHLKPNLGAVPLRTLSPFHVENLYKALSKKVSPSEVRRAGSTLSMICGYGVDNNLLPRNPTRRVKKPPRKRTTFRAWDQQEAATFLATAVGNRLEAYFVLALDTGMRPGELGGLYWPEVNLDAGTITVQNALTEVDGRLTRKG